MRSSLRKRCGFFFSNFSSSQKKLFLAVLKNIMFDWTAIIDKIEIYTTEYKWNMIQVKRLKWPEHPIYPACVSLNFKEFVKKKHQIWRIRFRFKKLDNIGISLAIENEKHSTSRAIFSNLLYYNGPEIQNANLTKPMQAKYIFQFVQNIFSEKDTKTKCKTYPNEDFNTFDECDRNFVLKTVRENYPLVPFWATKDMSEVTRQVFYEGNDIAKFIALLNGLQNSDCQIPCTTTKVCFKSAT